MPDRLGEIGGLIGRKMDYVKKKGRVLRIVGNLRTKKTRIKFDTYSRYGVIRLRNEIGNLRSYPVKCSWIILLRCRRECRRCRCYKIRQK